MNSFLLRQSADGTTHTPAAAAEQQPSSLTLSRTAADTFNVSKQLCEHVTGAEIVRPDGNACARFQLFAVLFSL